MTTVYNELITKTFCDNSIRSVMMIDDHFLPYSEYIDSLEAPDNISQDVKDGTRRAAKLMSFFHNKHFICDVDNAADHLNPEKIRKSDLLILDYHLAYNDPKKSLQILRSLRDNNHMNLAVIYTSEPLENVWLEVASTLKGKANNDLDANKMEVWDDLDDDQIETYKSQISSISELSYYVLNGTLTRKACQRIAQDPEIPQSAMNLKEYVAELILEESHNKLKSSASNLKLMGNHGDVKWICIGHLFIAFCQKTDNEDDSQQIWDTLIKALHDWEPNYYRLLSSELQNIIEDGNFAMKGYLESDYESQAAWLWRLKFSEKKQANLIEFYRGMKDILWDEVVGNNDLNNFSIQVIENCFKPTSPSIIPDAKQEPSAWVNYDETALIECTKHTFNGDNIKIEPKNIIHALNENISSKPFNGHHITVGTIVRHETKEQYLLCVTPSCDTVPKQYTDAMSKSMKPDRLMKFIRLNPCNLDNALSLATHSKYIFIKDGKKKIALSVVSEESDLPSIIYAIVKNHDNCDLTKDKTIKFEFIDNNQQHQYQPASQMREAYAARFQSMASHHAGRIGVDYVPYKSTSATPVAGEINLKGHIENPYDMIVEGAINLDSFQNLEGSVNINSSNLTVKSAASGKTPVNITGEISVESRKKTSDEIQINSELEVSSKNE